MYHHGHNQTSAGQQARKSTSLGEKERRDGNRHSFTAGAEVVDRSSGARFSTRTTDLGPGGCFVDTMVPFPVGTSVHVNVHKDETHFETDGVVVYSQLGLGMGIAFDVVEVTQREALDAWIEALTAGRQPAPTRGTNGNAKPAALSAALASGNKSAAPALARLVQLMVGKGIFTESEGAAVLHEPLL